MANREIVIKIPEKQYEMIQNISNFISADANQIIRDGIPLPKGHGRLIDADALMYRQTHHGNYYIPFELIDEDDLNNSPTIIEADKAGSEET